MPDVTILRGGGNRSGSIWQHNAVRLILTVKGVAHYGVGLGDYDPSRPERVHVVKVHDRAAIARFPRSRMIGGYRKARDVVDSLARMGWLANRRARPLRGLVDRLRNFNRFHTVRRSVDDYLANRAAWSANAAYMMRYEDMIADPVAEVMQHGRAIGFEVDAEQAREIVARVAALRPPGDRPSGSGCDYDRETLLRPGHVGGGAKRLDPRARAYVERRCARWLCDHGYAT